MKRTTRDLLLVSATLLPFLVLVLIVPPVLALQGWIAWIARLAFLLLGLVAASIVLLYLRARRKAFPEPAPDDIESALLEAERRLASSGRNRIGRLSVVVLLGPHGSTKTTVVVRSGLQPELLAGVVHVGDDVVPTHGVNLWLAEETVFVEASGALRRDDSRWQRLVRRLEPSRLAAVLPGGGQAPRAAVVCFGCDELLQPSASAAVQPAAQRLRAQLVDIADHHGVRLPVYVLFTKADRLPHFADYARNFTREEAKEVLGATLPIAPDHATVSWAEREAARVGAAFDEIFHSLAQRRLDVLAREPADRARAHAYEFPRELRKVAAVATQFLVDVCRPSQLGASAFLRGFYFTGVRAVECDDAEPRTTAAPITPHAVDATAVFNPQSTAQPRRATPSRGTRVPEWAFLHGVFGPVVLNDGVARAITAGGTRVNLIRRTAAGAATAALLLLCTALLGSWRANSRVVAEAVAAARGVDGLDLSGSGVPPLDDLERLDIVRTQLDRLREWDMRRPPLSHRWGLFVGHDVRETLRPLYFHRFGRMLWAPTRARLVRALDQVPATPWAASDYGATYDALKAHLITTTHPHESTVEFLSPVLMRHWKVDRRVDEARAARIERQFAFFAAELPHGNPFADAPDDRIVPRVRNYLSRFGSIGALYQSLIAEASEVAPAARFAGAAVVSNDFVVPGAYTARGWHFIDSSLADIDRLFARESWVLGGATPPEADRARIAADLRTRYVNDYVQQWLQYLLAGRVGAFAGAVDAAAKLSDLSGSQSPMLRLLAMASHQTGHDSVVIGQAFQPVHTVLPPSATDQLIVEEANQSYMRGLVALQAALEQVAGAADGPARERAFGAARSAADQLKIEVQQKAQGFNSEGEARAVGSAVVRLLLAPIRGVETLLAAMPAADANAKGRSFCAQLAPLLRKFPFNARAAQESDPSEVSAMLQPGSSALWNFYEENVRELLMPQGEGYGRIAGAALQPTHAFEAFFNRAAEVSRALFTGEAPGPEVVFELRPEPTARVTEIRVDIDGQVQSVSAVNRASRTFIWQAAASREARITATVGGETITVAQAQGPWAVFRLFHQADRDWERIATGHHRLRWNLAAQNLVISAELRFGERVSIFKPDYFETFECVSRMIAG